MVTAAWRPAAVLLLPCGVIFGWIAHACLSRLDARRRPAPAFAAVPQPIEVTPVPIVAPAPPPAVVHVHLPVLPISAAPIDLDTLVLEARRDAR